MLSFISGWLSSQPKEEINVIEPISKYRVVETKDGLMLEHWGKTYSYVEEDYIMEWKWVDGPFKDLDDAKEAHRLLENPTIVYL